MTPVINAMTAVSTYPPADRYSSADPYNPGMLPSLLPETHFIAVQSPKNNMKLLILYAASILRFRWSRSCRIRILTLSALEAVDLMANLLPIYVYVPWHISDSI